MLFLLCNVGEQGGSLAEPLIETTQTLFQYLEVKFNESFVFSCVCNLANKISQMFSYAGVGSGFVFNSATVAVSEYFVKYRPLALGLSMTGSGVANITFPWITMVLISEFGWRGLFSKIICSSSFLL